MKTMIINGKEIKTNYSANRYSSLPNTINPNYSIPNGMTLDEFLNKMVEKGYTKITFYTVTTCVRGYHNFYSNCK